MAPCVGCISTWKAMPTPTVLTSTGKNATERRKVRPMIGPVSSRASAMPRTTLSPQVTTAYVSVCVRPEISAGSAKNWRKLSSPMNSWSNSVQRVRLK